VLINSTRVAHALLHPPPCGPCELLWIWMLDLGPPACHRTRRIRNAPSSPDFPSPL
jgi:hypothetical protein